MRSGPRLPIRLMLIPALLLAATMGIAACDNSSQTAGYPPPVVDPAAARDPGYPAPGDEASEDVDEDGADEAQTETAEDPTIVDEGSMLGGDLGGRVIRIGTDATYPPFESEEPDGAIVGFDPDLLRLLCDHAGCTAEFVATDWTGIFAALKAGEFDALMSAITILPEREENSGGLFTVPYYSIGQVIVAAADNADIAGIDDLASTEALVGVQTGTTGDTAATEGGVPEDSMQRYDTIPLAFQALLNGDLDAIVCDAPTAANYVGENPDDLRVVGEPFTTEDYGILVPDYDTELLDALNAAILALDESGDIARLAEIHGIE